MKDIEFIISELVKANNNDLALEEVKNIYLKRCKHETREDTYIYYKKHLEVILSFFKDIKVTSTSQIDNDTLYDFIDYERAKGLKNNTINKRICTLKQSLQYCEDQNLIRENPMRRFKKLKPEDVEIKTIDKNILKSILSYLHHTEQTNEVIRTKAIIYILIDTGVRKNELRNIKLTELDLNNNQIHLKYTKTNRHRTVYFGEVTKKVIEVYLNEIEPNEYLIETITERKQMASNGLDKVIRKIEKKLNLQEDVSISFHKFRHTYATDYLEAGANLEFVRETLGHAKITTTQSYLHLSNTHLQEQHSKFSPLNKIK